MKRLALGIIFVFVGLVSLAVVVAKSASSKTPPVRIFLSAEQIEGIKQADDVLANLQKQYSEIAKQRDVLIAGYALSDKTIAKDGMDWSKKWKYSEADGKKYFEHIDETSGSQPQASPGDQK